MPIVLALGESAAMNFIVRIGEYLFRPLRNSASDTEFVLALRNSPRFSQWFYNSHITAEMHARFLSRPQAANEVNWLVEHHSRPVGVSSIYHLDLDGSRVECGRIAAIS